MENLYKYPRTLHADLSEHMTTDDKMLFGYSDFENHEIIVTLKLDGENCSMYNDYIHARSLDSNNHPSRNWVKGLHGNIKYLIPKDWRVCGENMYAEHSVSYDNLDSYFYCFNIWDENNRCLSVDDTLDWCKLFEIEFVPIVYRGIFNLKLIEEMYNDLDKEKNEGFVVRKVNSFNYDDFSKNYFKIVRKNHVQTDEHWMSKPIIFNKLKEKSE